MENKLYQDLTTHQFVCLGKIMEQIQEYVSFSTKKCLQMDRRVFDTWASQDLKDSEVDKMLNVLSAKGCWSMIKFNEQKEMETVNIGFGIGLPNIEMSQYTKIIANQNEFCVYEWFIEDKSHQN